jgi:hypothetical protein
MNLYELLKKGYVIRIEDNRESAVHGFYDPAEYWMKDGELLAWCPEVGILKCTCSKEEMLDNFDSFLSDGLDIIIKHKNEFVRRT